MTNDEKESHSSSSFVIRHSSFVTGEAGLRMRALTSAYDLDVRSLALVLRIPPRTLARRRRERRLRPDESDRLFRVARIAALAEEALGGRDRAARWLKRPNRALGNAIPLDHLDTDLGARQVEDILGRISHGIYS